MNRKSNFTKKMEKKEKVNAFCPIISIEINVADKEGPVLPKRVSNRWPAIILAANRTAKVPGRITFLMVSINTIKGIRAPGVPCGTR